MPNSTYTSSVQLFQYIESKNSHGRKQLLEKINEYGLGNSRLYREVLRGSTNIGKNQLKNLWLKCFIYSMREA